MEGKNFSKQNEIKALKALGKEERETRCPAIENNSEFWNKFHDDFAYWIFKPYMASNYDFSIYYVEKDNYSIDIDIEGLNFKKVSMTVGYAQELINKINEINESSIWTHKLVTRFHDRCLLRITIRHD